MQFNSHSDNQDIVSSVVDATGLNATAHLKKITRAANEALRIIWSWIFEAYGGWQYDDGKAHARVLWMSLCPGSTWHQHAPRTRELI